MTKIDIVSGFLGAGKTTLIKKLLAEAYKGEKLVLIENEFGEINIDGGFLKESGIQISEMSAGCICCSLVGDFNKALKDVESQFHPDRILIEPSGVGKLSDVIVAVENTVKDVPEMKLNSFVTVADATKVKVYMKNFGEFYNNQIEAAGTIILSRTQKMTQEKLEAAVSMLREKTPMPPSSLPLGMSWMARPSSPPLKKSLWPMNCWRRCGPNMRPMSTSTITIIMMARSATIPTAPATTMTMSTRSMSMNITIMTMTMSTRSMSMNITIMTMTMSTSMTSSITMTMTSAAAMSMNTSIIMTTASAMTPTAPAMTITIITTPMRCSSPGVRKHPRCIHRRTSTVF